MRESPVLMIGQVSFLFVLALGLSGFPRTHVGSSENYNRWLVVPASFMVQGSVGSVYAWSVWNAPLMKVTGVVAASSADWALQPIVGVFTTSACALGLTTFQLGPW